MIKIKTFIKLKNEMVSLEQLDSPPTDIDLIEGSIDLTIEGVVVLSGNVVDLVDDLWAYLIEGIANVKCGNDFSTYYPDQPIEVKYRLVGRSNISVQCHIPGKAIRTSITNLSKFCSELLLAAHNFFIRLNELTQSNTYENEIKMISDLQSDNRETISKYIYR